MYVIFFIHIIYILSYTSINHYIYMYVYVYVHIDIIIYMYTYICMYVGNTYYCIQISIFIHK